jgi:tRNA (cytidine/uridine-2'-O-)-methyltransferase
MIDVVLVHPEIPPNTGNVIRMCANTGSRLHLVEPLGFTLGDAQLRRAGLDYRDLTTVTVHASWSDLRAALADRRLLAFTTTATQRHTQVRYGSHDALVFGCESVGLPPDIVAEFPAQRQVRIPMVTGSRSLNLSNAVAVGVYEAWRQQDFPHGR